MTTDNYNKTQLHPLNEFNRHIYHRDQFAHYLRWTHVLKIAKIGMQILDVGCGSGNLCEVFYRNRFKPKVYLGIDIREKTIDEAHKKWEKQPWARFEEKDICIPINKKARINSNYEWDIICCFEVLEHIGKENLHKVLDNLRLLMTEDTILLISTPCYDESVGAAQNHMIDDEVGEFGYNELRGYLEDYFILKNHWGTFASQKDYKEWMSPEEKRFYDKLHEYYDSNILSNLMAPLFPELSRNVLWRLKLKGE